MAEFALDPAFEGGSIAVGDLPLCHVRLQTDARWPWLILIPRRPGLREVEDVSAADRARLIEETVLAGQAVRAIGAATGFTVEKLNIGALGNVTPQLHVHVVGRRAGDAAWPGPVWGVGVAEAYEAEALEAAVAAVRGRLDI
ncbi:MAG: HIT domain-containing protein [Caulobacter sp.]|nr:HIT domain-containing protein [Caulobacter sp.]